MKRLLTLAIFLSLTTVALAETYDKVDSKLQVSDTVATTFKIEELTAEKGRLEARIAEIQAKLDLVNKYLGEADKLGIKAEAVSADEIVK